MKNTYISLGLFCFLLSIFSIILRPDDTTFVAQSVDQDSSSSEKTDAMLVNVLWNLFWPSPVLEKEEDILDEELKELETFEAELVELEKNENEEEELQKEEEATVEKEEEATVEKEEEATVEKEEEVTVEKEEEVTVEKKEEATVEKEEEATVEKEEEATVEKEEEVKVEKEEAVKVAKEEVKVEKEEEVKVEKEEEVTVKKEEEGVVQKKEEVNVQNKEKREVQKNEGGIRQKETSPRLEQVVQHKLFLIQESDYWETMRDVLVSFYTRIETTDRERAIRSLEWAIKKLIWRDEKRIMDKYWISLSQMRKDIAMLIQKLYLGSE